MKSSMRGGSLIFFALLLMAAAGESPAAMTPALTPLPDFDRRERASQDGGAATADQRAGLNRLRTRLPKVHVDFDAVTGAPKFISGEEEFLSATNGQGRTISPASAASFAVNDPYRATKAFLSEHNQFFGHGSEVLDKARVKREFETPHNGLKTVVWEQEVNGIPVFEAVLIAHMTRRGELVNLSSQFLPDPDGAASRGVPNRARLVAAPDISARKAVFTAARNIGEEIAEEAIAPVQDNNETQLSSGPEKRQEFKAAIFKGNAEAKLIWLPMSRDRMRLCWDVILMSRTRGEMFRELVDAQTGEPLLRHCLTDYISEATYRVYTSDSPSAFSPGYSTPTSTQPPLVVRALVTISALDTNASPNGWINDGANETRGNNVDAHTDRNADNQPDVPRPQGSPFRVFDFPLDLTQAPSTYTNAAVVQLFYWNNWMHDKLYELGFTEAAGNFQSNNFGRGGSGNDAVQADAQDGSGINNANFSTPPDGSAGRMQMYVFTGPTPDRDGDLDAEVMLHEYTHGLSNRRVGGGVGISALQTRGMGEGWSDFYALALLSEPGDDVNGVYASGAYSSYLLSGLTQNYYFGIRRYPYCTDTNKNPLTFKDIDPGKASAHSGIPRSPVVGTSASEVHNMGEVWCVTLCEARANLINKYGWAVGNQLILQLVTDGMNLSPANPNFLQARDAILQADQVDTGGANLFELWSAFAKRGMGSSATSPSSSTSTGVQEAFNIPILPLRVLVPISATEGDGVLVGAGQVQLLSLATSNVTVTLSSSKVSEVTVPPSVTVLAGQSNAVFDLTIIDDAVLDGTQTSTITGSSPGYTTSTANIAVFDNETATLQVTLPANATEGQGTVQGTVQVSAAPAASVVVILSSSDTTEIQVPASVTIPSGQTSAVFTATVVDDNQLDGPQSATVTAHVQNWTDGSATITVLDNVNLTVTLPASAPENAGVLTNAGSVRIPGASSTNLIVSLTSGNPARLTVPPSVTIPAGQLSNAFNLTLVDNSLQDGHQTVTVTASAPNFTNGTASMLILDDESPPIPSNPRPGDLAVNVPANTNLIWNSGATSESVSNGGFETGTFANWLKQNSGAGDFVINNGTYDPPGPEVLTPPFAGGFSVVSEQTGAGTHVLYQDITLAPGTSSAVLKWTDRIRNFATQFASSQYFHVEIRTTNNTLIQIAFTTNPGDPLTNNWVTRSFDLSSYIGQKIRIAFVESDSLGYFNVHLDNIGVQVNGSNGTITNDVYFGTNPTPGPAEFQGSTTNSSWTLPLLLPLTTYYWQIVAHKGGTAAGPVWQFTTAGVDHFAWDVVPSPQFVNQPFGVTITAKDAFNTTVSNFTGAVGFKATGGSDPGILFGDNFEDGNFSDWTIGSNNATRAVTNDTAAGGNYSFTIFGGNNNHYQGIWHTLSNLTPSRVNFSVRASVTNLSGGYFVLANATNGALTSTANTAVFFFMKNNGMMGLYEDVGSNHMVLYDPNRWYRISLLFNWANKTVDYLVDGTLAFASVPFRATSVNSLSIVHLYNYDSTRAWWDEIEFLGGNVPAPISLSPTNSGNYVTGVWSGNIIVQQPATNVTLFADDGSGHTGSSNPFIVTVTNDVSISIVDSPDPVSVGASLTYTLTITNTGPTDATSVMVTNTLPASVTFISATSSQGSCAQTGSVVTCDLGLIPGGTNATITITVVPTIAGTTITNFATVSRGEVESYLGNNTTAAATVVTTPAISIADASVTERNVGANNMTFAVTLAAPSAQTITVNYATANGTAMAGNDYISTNGVLTVPPGTTNGTITVAVIGDALIESNETFFVNLTSPVNGVLGRSQGVGTILNDDGLPGQIDHFTWSVIASLQYTDAPFGVTISAVDASNNLVTNFAGTVSLYSASNNVVPMVSGNFTNGSWDGNVAVLNRATNAVLVADDGDGHLGSSNPFNVVPANMPPVILAQPANQTVVAGNTATFTVGADGTPPLSYQWNFNGTNIPGATGATFALTNVQLSNAGNYAVLVTNAYGSMLSSNATLAVVNVPIITSFSPLFGSVGTIVSIMGNYFDPAASNNIVYFGAVQTAVTAASVTNLAVSVPASATYSPITVTVNGLVAYAPLAFEPAFAGDGNSLDASAFAAGFNLAASGGPDRTVIADMDGDGKPDFVVVQYYIGQVWVYRNISTNGTLTADSFAAPVVLAVGSSADGMSAMTVADLDGDGRLDVVVADGSVNTVTVLQNFSKPGNIASNTFSGRLDFPVGIQPMDVAVRDLDGDGKPEIVVANFTSSTVSVLANLGVSGILTTNSFGAPIDLPTASGTHGIALGDLDGDGRPDIVAVNNSGASDTISVFRNLGGTVGITTNFFAPRIDFAGGGEMGVIGDLDGDGEPDVLVGSWQRQSLSVFHNLSSPGLFTTNSLAGRVDFAAGGNVHNVALGDLNGDGKPDVVLVTELPSHLSLFQNVSTPGNITPTSLAARVDFGSGWNPSGMSVGDLDGDGRPDIVFGNFYDGTITVYQNIMPIGPLVTLQPTNFTLTVGATATFTVSASGTPPLNYQWYFNGTNLLTGATNTSLILTNVQVNQSGNYSVVVSNMFSSTTSSNAVLTVNPPPTVIVFGPVVDHGDFVVRFAGVPGLTYTIEAASNLTGSWVKVISLTAPTTDTGFGVGVFEFRESLAANSARFYRTVYPPY
jgi:uncharacterized repeat protein (TIGR01451 family)